MENRSEELYVRIEDPKIGTNSIIGMSLAFGLGFLVCIVVGATGPPIFMTDPDSVVNMQILPGQNNTLWNGEVSGLSMYHRDLYVTALIQRPGFFDPSSVVPLNMDFSYTQDIWITITAKTRTGSVLTLANTYLKEVTVSCEASEQWCNTLLIYYDHLVEYPQFYIKAEFVMPKTVNGKKFGGVYNMIVKIAYQSPKYTVFMLGWTYFFLGVTFLVMFFPCYGFFWVMAQVKRDKWTTQQMWISGLLCTLFLYDDPFFAAELLQSGDDLAVLYVFFMATFISSILLFWLVMLDEIRIDAARDSNPPRLPKWFLPKVVLCFAIWVILLGAYISVKRHQMIDPSYDATGKKARPYYGALAAFMIFYILWILYLAISCLHHVRKMIPGYRFLFFYYFNHHNCYNCGGISHWLLSSTRCSDWASVHFWPVQPICLDSCTRLHTKWTGSQKQTGDKSNTGLVPDSKYRDKK